MKVLKAKDHYKKSNDLLQQRFVWHLYSLILSLLKAQLYHPPTPLEEMNICKAHFSGDVVNSL